MATPITPSSSTNQPAPASGFQSVEEQLLSLPDGRTLAYEHSGPPDSNLVFIWYHGLFSVGDATVPLNPGPVQRRNAHYVSPTLPGWGNTSPLLPGTTFAETVVGDTLALLRHLYPTYDPTTLRIYVAGGSFGTVPAQIVFGASYERFPYGRQIAGMLLMAPFSPFREDTGYRRWLSWRDWVSVGPLTRVVPGNLVPQLMKLALQGKMSAEERTRYEEWRVLRGAGEGEFARRMAEGMVRSVSRSWAGFLGVADAIHGDWGFTLGEVDSTQGRKPVILGVGEGDTSLLMMAKYLSDHYGDARVSMFAGGHLASAWSMDALLEEMFVAGEGASNDE
ncbi:Alpha/Beta hydrolase protein [Trametes maxima]|nr:Alpha/Beta hydrolase protein [Trametes maxima]